jgi:hypothetical protein
VDHVDHVGLMVPEVRMVLMARMARWDHLDRPAPKEHRER